MTTPRRRKVWQHDTENVSEGQICEYFHRLGWDVDRFGKDYGEDLFVRIFEEGASTGKSFFVQLKGTNNIQQYALRTRVFSYSVDVVNLLQWHRNQFPVIFVLWDIEQRVGYWLHIQSYVDKRLKKGPLWLKQEGKRNVHIPFDQLIPWGEDDSLLTLINAEQPLWQMLEEVNQELDAADPHYRLETRLTSTGIEITAVEKYPGAAADNPINIRFTTSIPTDTEEGRDLVERINQFRALGIPVRIPLSYVKNLEIPEFITQALPEITKDGFFALGPAHNPKPLLMRFEFTNDYGEQFTLDYVYLKVSQAGTKEITFTNDEQPIPINVKVIVYSDSNAVTTYFAFKSTPDMNVHQKLMQLDMMSCLSKPYVGRFVNLETGHSGTISRQSLELYPTPDQHALEVIRALNALQVKTGKVVCIPERDLTIEEDQIIERLRLIFLTGKLTQTWNSFTSTVSITPESIAGLKQLLDSTEKTEVFPSPVEETITLFCQEYSLGKIKPYPIEVKLANDQEVRKKLLEQTEGEIELKFAPNGDPTFVKVYLNWLSDKDEVV